MILRDWLIQWEVWAEIHAGGWPQSVALVLGDYFDDEVREVFSTDETVVVRVPSIKGNASTLLLEGSTLWALEDGEETISAVCTALKGHHLDCPTVNRASDGLDWTGYYPVIDGELMLTGGWMYADSSGTYLNYGDKALITRVEAKKGGWVLDIDEGTAQPPQKVRVATILELSDEDWDTAGLPRPTDSEFLAVLEGLKQLYNDMWEQDFKETTAMAKAALEE